MFFLNDKNGYKANVNQEILQNYEIQSSSEIVRLFLLSKLMAYRGKISFEVKVSKIGINVIVDPKFIIFSAPKIKILQN